MQRHSHYEKKSGVPTWLARNTDQMKPGNSGVDIIEDKGREKVYRSNLKHASAQTRPKLRKKARMRTHVPPNML